VRVEPKHFGLPTGEAIEKQLNESYVDRVTKELGYVIAVVSVGEVDDGVIIPGMGRLFIGVFLSFWFGSRNCMSWFMEILLRLRILGRLCRLDRCRE